MKILLVLLMSFNLVCFGFCDVLKEITSPTYLYGLVDKMDLVSYFKDDYPIVCETKQFEIIVYDYAYRFIDYLCDGKTTYTISDKQEALLFKEIMDQYPQFENLPTDLLIENLVSSIDLNDYLPDFESLIKEVPPIWFYLVEVVKYQYLFLVLFFVCVICLFLVNSKVPFLSYLFSFLISLIVFLIVDEIILKNWALSLQVEIKYCIIMSIVCLGGYVCEKNISFLM